MKKELLLLTSALASVATVSAQEKQNIIFILCDDLGWADLSCNGSEFYETPNIDKLAQKGIFFSNAHSAAPVSSPARGAIMTGRAPSRTGYTGLSGQWGRPSKGTLIDADFAPNVATEEHTIAESFKAYGYSTLHFGKWHLGDKSAPLTLPLAQGFDRYVTGYEDGKWEKGRFNDKGEFITDLLTDRALEAIKENKDNAFYLNMWYYAVHTPIIAKPDDIAYFTQKAKMMGLDTQEALVVGERNPALSWFMQSKGVYPNVTRRIIQSNPTYAAFLFCLDQNIGRIVSCLEDLGIDDKTTIVFYSDNGGLSSSEGSPTCNAPLNEGKGWSYEGGVRVPLIVYHPDAKVAGERSEQPITGTDIYPTLLELAGLPLEKEHHLDGESFKPIFDGKKTKRSPICWHSPHYFNQGGHPFSSVYDGEWKYVYFYDLEQEFLYNMKNDLSEQNNLATTKPKEVKRLREILDAYLEDVDAKYMTKNPDYKAD